MKAEDLAVRQKRLQYWRQAAGRPGAPLHIVKQIAGLADEYGALLAAAWQAGGPAGGDLQRFADFERRLAQLDEEARMTRGASAS